MSWIVDCEGQHPEWKLLAKGEAFCTRCGETRPLRIGSLFSGYGGLDLGVQAVIGGSVAWHVEFAEAPSKILAHHWPDVPNYHDVTNVDWANVEPVDVLTGGFPCQDVSLAGARAGLMDGTRSGLWSEYAKAIDALRPSLVLIENVRGLLSAKTMEEVDETDSDLEWEPGGVGEPAGVDRPVLNAFGRVLGDLAELGYVGRWLGIRAADAGAPHGRYRVFIVAYPKRGPDWERLGGSEVRRWSGEAEQAGLGDRLAPNADHLGHERAGSTRDGGARSTDDGRSVADSRGVRSKQSNSAAERGSEGAHRSGMAIERGVDDRGTDWGEFETAIRFWERRLGRPAPAPREAGKLSSRFTEWMMGLQEGHVTDPAIGLTWNEQLKALGNGVVWQQAALALSILLVPTTHNTRTEKDAT